MLCLLLLLLLLARQCSVFFFPRSLQAPLRRVACCFDSLAEVCASGSKRLSPSSWLHEVVQRVWMVSVLCDLSIVGGCNAGQAAPEYLPASYPRGHRGARPRHCPGALPVRRLAALGHRLRAAHTQRSGRLTCVDVCGAW